MAVHLLAEREIRVEALLSREVGIVALKRQRRHGGLSATTARQSRCGAACKRCGAAAGDRQPPAAAARCSKSAGLQAASLAAHKGSTRNQAHNHAGQQSAEAGASQPGSTAAATGPVSGGACSHLINHKASRGTPQWLLRRQRRRVRAGQTAHSAVGERTVPHAIPPEHRWLLSYSTGGRGGPASRCARPALAVRRGAHFA